MSEEDDDRDTLPQPDWHQEWTDLALEPTQPQPGARATAVDLPTLRKMIEDRGDESQTESRPQIRRQEGR